MAAIGLTGITRGDLEVELVVDARDHVALEQELGHVERVDHVGALEVHVDRLAGRHEETALRSVLLADSEDGLRVDLCVSRQVFERPGELAGDRAHREVGLRADCLDAVERLPRDHEEKQHDQGRDERPGDLCEVVAVRLRREDVVTGLAVIADDRPDDQALDDEEDDGGDRENDVVEVADLRALDALRRRREEAVPDRRSVEDHQHRHADQDRGGNQPADDRGR